MHGRVNHRGWTVVDSVNSDDHLYCVDLFVDPEGAFGFELFRAEPEDGGAWTLLGGFSGRRYPAPGAAADAARAAVPWLSVDRSAAGWRTRWSSGGSDGE